MLGLLFIISKDRKNSTMELMGKVFRWWVCVTLFIFGTGFLAAVQFTGSVKPVFVCILSYGVVYWLSKSFLGLPRKLLAINVGVLGIAGACSFIFYPEFYQYVDIARNWGEYDIFLAWTLWSYAIGIPVMALSFAKWD